MQSRSWMAALTVAAATVLPLASPALADEKPAPPPQTVAVDLHITGLGRNGCDIEIKPGHGGCQFRPVVKHIGETGKDRIRLSDVRTTSADRACTIAISIREPGHAVR